MQPNKYKIWDSESQVFIPPTTQGVVIGIDGSVQKKSYVLLQWTGFSDNEGNDIFNGDILESHTGRIGTVEWERGAWVVHGTNHQKVRLSGWAKSLVIGSKYTHLPNGQKVSDD
jgi:hypothetical protein